MRMTNRLFTFTIICVLFFGLSHTTHADRPPSSINQIPLIPDVVARVNGSDISSKHIKFEFLRVLKNARTPMTSVQKDTVVRKVIDKEVVRELMYQEGQKINLKVDSETVDAELKALRLAYKNHDDFNKALADRNITEDDLKRSIEVDALAKMILENHVKGNVKIDDKTVQEYYMDNKENFLRPVAFRVRHILISPFSPDLVRNSKIDDLQARKEELREKARSKILEIQSDLKNGGDIAELAKKFSHDESTANSGGDLGFFYADGMEKTFSDAVSKLKIGEVSDIVETKSGFHLVKLLETKPSELAPFKDMEEAIQKHLFLEKAQSRVLDYVASLRKKANIEVFY